jgi:hypothetical protein
MAFVSCALIMYISWWSKPFGVERSTIITFPASMQARVPVLSDFRLEPRDRIRNMTDDVVVNMLNTSRPSSKLTTFTFYAVGTAFSASHIAAWNWEFPSSVVQILWRIFGVAATSTASISIVLNFIANLECVSAWVSLFIVCLITFIYSTSRIALIVLIFYCFSSMPAGVYETVEWTNHLPHFS